MKEPTPTVEPLVNEGVRSVPSRDVFAKTIRYQRNRLGKKFGPVAGREPIHSRNISCIVYAMKQLEMRRDDIRHPLYNTKANAR